MQNSNLQIDMRRTGAKIKSLCKERNITVKDIQRQLYIGAFQTVYDWFSGKSLPSLDNFYRLSKMLNVHMEDIIQVVASPSVDLAQYNMIEHKYLIAYYERMQKYA